MAKVGRNDPCPCGSGKKYKVCHLPIEEAAQAEQRRLSKGVDTLLPKIIDAAQGLPEAIPAALERFWNGKYTPDQLAELDDIEDRGAQRFLTWFAFDYLLDDGRTLVERLAAGEGDLSLDDTETRLLKDWTSVRLRPYIVEMVLKGQGMRIRELVESTSYQIEDHAASRRMQPSDVLIVHVIPAGERFFIGGAAAHLTPDTAEKLQEFAALHVEADQRDSPGATWSNVLRTRSEILNHFVMALPVAEPDPSLLEQFVVQTRAALKLTGQSLGLSGKQEDEQTDES